MFLLCMWVAIPTLGKKMIALVTVLWLLFIVFTYIKSNHHDQRGETFVVLMSIKIMDCKPVGILVHMVCGFKQEREWFVIKVTMQLKDRIWGPRFDCYQLMCELFAYCLTFWGYWLLIYRIKVSFQNVRFWVFCSVFALTSNLLQFLGWHLPHSQELFILFIFYYLQFIYYYLLLIWIFIIIPLNYRNTIN